MVGAFLAGGLTSQVFFSVLLKPITAEFGWSRSEVTGAITLGTITGGLISPVSGTLVDRFGPRILAPAGAIIVALALLVLSSVHSLLVFYIAFIIARSVSSATVTGVVAQSLAANWFRRMRGRVFGFLAMAVPLGGSVGALAAQPLIDGPGWRSIFVIAPILLIVLFALPALVLFRRGPEEIGLLPDGALSVTTNDSSVPTMVPEDSWSLPEAIRTSALWFLVSGTLIGRLASGAVSFHLVAYYTDKGMSAGIAALAISLYALFGAIASFIWGFLIERIPERLLLVAAMLLSGTALVLTLPVENAAPALTLAALYGLAGRGEGTLVNTVLAQYFGRASFGRIAGMISPFNMAALGLGPLIASLSFDVAGSYTIAFAGFSASYLVSASLLWFMRPPVRPTER
jgi:MFS family permease